MIKTLEPNLAKTNGASKAKEIEKQRLYSDDYVITLHTDITHTVVIMKNISLIIGNQPKPRRVTIKAKTIKAKELEESREGIRALGDYLNANSKRILQQEKIITNTTHLALSEVLPKLKISASIKDALLCKNVDHIVLDFQDLVDIYNELAKACKLGGLYEQATDEELLELN